MERTKKDYLRTFLLTFFDKEEGDEEKIVNGFRLKKFYDNRERKKRWKVSILK